MRFRPIGFGSGSTGVIGSSSSSVDESGSESSSDEEMADAPSQFHRPASLEAEESATSSDGSEDHSSASSDAEMIDAPPLQSNSVSKSTSPKSAAKESPRTADHPPKRKHSEGGDVKAKNSSSSSEASTNNRELKGIKKRQTNSLVGSQSLSTETPKTKSPKQPHVPPTSTSPIPAPRANHNHLPGFPSQTIPSLAKSAPVLPSKSSQILPSRSSQPSIVHPASKKGSETPLRDLMGKENAHSASLDISQKGRKKGAKKIKKDKSKLVSELNV